MAAETRPMVIHDDRLLLAAQETADRMPELHDPVFCLDYDLGSLSVVAQVEGLTASDAASHAEKLFTEAMLGAGITNRIDIVECVEAHLYADDADFAIHTYRRTLT